MQQLEFNFTCKHCGCTPKPDEWAVNSNEYCIDCEHESNDWFNACHEGELTNFQFRIILNQEANGGETPVINLPRP